MAELSSALATGGAEVGESVGLGETFGVDGVDGLGVLATAGDSLAACFDETPSVGFDPVGALAVFDKGFFISSFTSAVCAGGGFGMLIIWR